MSNAALCCDPTVEICRDIDCRRERITRPAEDIDVRSAIRLATGGGDSTLFFEGILFR